MTFGIGIFDFGADVADVANRPDGIKLLRIFCGFGAIALEKDYLACNTHRHYLRAMRHILRFAHWAIIVPYSAFLGFSITSHLKRLAIES